MVQLTKKGFTLIELLIVVAIIAILAAIATPNFLEAQTRSKVTRAKADMRSVVTAIESYRVDENRYPPCTPNGFGLPALSAITTPISYITGVNIQDPFWGKTQGEFTREYGWNSRDGEQRALIGSGRTGIWFLLTSNGPDTEVQNDGATPYWDLLDADDTAGFIDTIYDPTNGIVSNGNLYRSGGQFTGNGAKAAAYVATGESKGVY